MVLQQNSLLFEHSSIERLGNRIYLEMIPITGGTFMMGTPRHQWMRYSVPQHKVTVSSFFMGKYPITQAQYQAVIGKNPSKFQGDNFPVVRVSWDEAVEFCQVLSKQTGRKYCLPSEAEWEYACRAETKTRFHFGQNIPPRLANKVRSMGITSSVYRYRSNAFGLCGMHGNVCEWCQDDWHDNYESAPNNENVWLSKASNKKVVRSGSCSCHPYFLPSAYRKFHIRNIRYDDVGFRVVCGLTINL